MKENYKKVYKISLTKNEICSFIDKIEDEELIDKILKQIDLQNSYIGPYKNPNYFKEYYMKHKNEMLRKQKIYRKNKKRKVINNG